MKRSLTHEPVTSKVSSSEREWTIYLPKAYHPLLLQQHKQKTQQAWKDLESANTVSYTGTEICCLEVFFFHQS